MKMWQKHKYKYYKLAKEHGWLPTASHCSKMRCLDHDCPVNQEILQKMWWHYTGEWR